VDDVTWGAFTLTLTAIGGFYTWWAYRNRGATPAIRGLALTLLPAAAYLTGTLKMFTQIANAITHWATHLVFSPSVWLGIMLAGLSVFLFVLAGFLRRRGVGVAKSSGASVTGKAPASGKALPAAKAPAQPLDDDGLDDEIAAILKRRGIS
jgi:hypothetical protein